MESRSTANEMIIDSSSATRVLPPLVSLNFAAVSFGNAVFSSDFTQVKVAISGWLLTSLNSRD